MTTQPDLKAMDLDDLRKLALDRTCSCYAYSMMDEISDTDRAACIEIVLSDGRCLHADNPDDYDQDHGACFEQCDRLLSA